MMDITRLSSHYDIRVLDDSDVDEILQLASLVVKAALTKAKERERGICFMGIRKMSAAYLSKTFGRK